MKIIALYIYICDSFSLSVLCVITFIFDIERMIYGRCVLFSMEKINKGTRWDQKHNRIRAGRLCERHQNNRKYQNRILFTFLDEFFLSFWKFFSFRSSPLVKALISILVGFDAKSTTVSVGIFTIG